MEPKKICLRCGGARTILMDVSRTMYSNRAERRRAGIYGGKKVMKWVPCPECSGK